MAKKKLTPAQKAAKTRKANQEKAMQALGFERKKVTRKRKPMTEEQRKAAAERLKLAREKRGHDGSKSVHHSIRDLPEDHFLHWKKVKEWIKECSLSNGWAKRAILYLTLMDLILMNNGKK